jgi:hypothetical protein
MSDLLFIDHHPYVGAGDPYQWAEILNQVAELAPMHLLPGHGPVGTADSLVMMKRYIRALDGLARELVEEGRGEDAIDAVAIPEPWGSWLLAAFFPLNIRFMFQQWSTRRVQASD